MSRIPSSQISVVVQGPIAGKPDAAEKDRLTKRCLESVRQHLPGAEIVLSTWKGSDPAGLSYDVYVESDDPGGTPCRIGEKYLNNVNRQIASTRAGLLAATRPYAVKLRSDMRLTGDGFLDFFGQYPARGDAWRIVKERVVTSTVYASNPRRGIPYCFHPSDWFFFGLREDVLDIWDIPFSVEPETSRWLEHRPRPDPDHDPLNLARLVPEQHIWVSFLAKHGPVPLQFTWDVSEDLIRSSEASLANNLVMVGPHHLNIEFMKYSFMRNHWLRLYTHLEWRAMYKRHCDPSHFVPPDIVAMYKNFGQWYIQATKPILKKLGFNGEYSVRWMMHVLFRPEGRIRRTLRAILRTSR
jgi:hypothetical protein